MFGDEGCCAIIYSGGKKGYFSAEIDIINVNTHFYLQHFVMLLAVMNISTGLLCLQG